VSSPTESRRYSTALLLPLFSVALFAQHAPLLQLPYFWDEAGYYIPAARDLLLTGSVIPHSTPSNAHPPLVMAYLALAWKLIGFSPVVTRTAMLLIAALSLLGVFRLAQRVANTEVAIGSVICTACYPVFFSQGSLAHVDLAAAGFTFWGMLAYVEHRRFGTALWFSLAVLTKETAILAPLALFGWELLSCRGPWPGLNSAGKEGHGPCPVVTRLALLVPLVPLGIWYGYHYLQTGFVFGNPEFFRYNVQATLRPLRIVLALGLRWWQVMGYLNLYFLTVATVLAMFRPPVRDGFEERERIALRVQFAFLAVILTYVLAMAVVGGAALSRYLLPVIPLIIIVCVSTLRRRVRMWWAVVGVVTLTFVVAWFVNPPYGFSFEDNLAYRDYIRLHQGAETYLEARYPMSRILTAWPASDEISRPYLGYVTRPMRVVRIDDFTAEQLLAANDLRSRFDVAVVFSTKYEPPHPWFERWRAWQQWKAEFFGYHRDVPPVAAAQLLGGQIVYEQHIKNQWVAVIEMERVEEAAKRPRRCHSEERSDEESALYCRSLALLGMTTSK